MYQRIGDAEMATNCQRRLQDVLDSILMEAENESSLGSVRYHDD